MPGNTGLVEPAPVFTPLAGFPYPGGLGPPSASCPIQRQSGVFGFVDTRSTADPNDDDEYFLACRSDGAFLILATPVVPSGQGVTHMTIPAGRYYDWLEDTHWGWLNDNPPAPGGRPTGLWNDLDLRLNGIIPPATPGNPPVPNAAESYCGNTTWIYFTSNHTTNREAVVWREPGTDRYFLFGINTLLPGIWIVEIQRIQGGTYDGLLGFVPGTDLWWNEGGALGKCHMIYLDQERGQIWVTDDSSAKTRGFAINGGAWPGNPQGMLTSVLDYQVIDLVHVGPNQFQSQIIRPHDAMPVGDRLFISFNANVLLPSPQTGDGTRVDVLDLDNLGAPADTVYTTTFLKSAHSVYYDAAAAPSPHLWVLQEDVAPTVQRNATQITYPTPPGQQAPVWVRDIPRCEGWYIDQGSPINPHGVHHLRGVNRTGFVAQYLDGVSLLDLTDPGPSSGVWQAIGSYDTTLLKNPPGGNEIQIALDKFLGTWDVFPGTDSGVVYVSGGELGAVVFRVEAGQLNRYWDATVFPFGAASAGMFPKVVSRFGPPRADSSLLVEDAHASLYTSSVGGVPVSYRYTLCYTAVEPNVQTAQWAPPFGAAGNTVILNLHQGSFTVLTNATLGDSQFHFPTVGEQGQRWFFQMFVEEMDMTVDPPRATGNWAASRGTWLGVAG